MLFVSTWVAIVLQLQIILFVRLAFLRKFALNIGTDVFFIALKFLSALIF